MTSPLSATSSNKHQALHPAQILTLLNSADQGLKKARKECESLSKVSAQTARCTGCEDRWRASVKNLARSVIAAGIAVAGVKRAVEEERGGLLVAEVGVKKGYHPWWVVPKVSTKREGK